ncbi:phage tail protein [Aliarcobacter cryaerophilus]|uniref:phage tail protein n=1 Tax=Aliarcobacter cryaerophilus TaxID=28198 RepID=UPI003BAFAFBA
MSEEEIKPIEKLSLFDESKSAIEGQKNFRENAAYSWSWLVAHTKELNVALIDFNNLVFKTFEKAQDVNYDVEEIKKHTLKIEASAKYVKDITEDIDRKFNSLREANQATKESLGLEKVENSTYYEKPVVFVDEYFEVPDDTTFEVKNILIVGPFYNKNNEDNLNCQAGEYKDFAMPNPKGRWLFCNGDAISRTKYKELFEAIGTRYGKGDGLTTFNIPDRRGLFSRTYDAGRGMDPEKRELGSLQMDELKSHNHQYSMATYSQSTWQIQSSAYYGNSTAETSNTGGAETRSRNMNVYTCIRW